MAEDNAPIFKDEIWRNLCMIENAFFFMDFASSAIDKKLRNRLQFPNICMHWLFAEVSPKNGTAAIISQVQNVKELWYSRSLFFGPQTALAYAWKQMTQENKACK